jgi:hypothetical protein
MEPPRPATRGSVSTPYMGSEVAESEKTVFG